MIEQRLFSRVELFLQLCQELSVGDMTYLTPYFSLFHLLLHSQLAALLDILWWGAISEDSLWHTMKRTLVFSEKY